MSGVDGGKGAIECLHIRMVVEAVRCRQSWRTMQALKKQCDKKQSQQPLRLYSIQEFNEKSN